MNDYTNAPLTDEQALGLLSGAAQVMRDVLCMVHDALQNVPIEEANVIFAARVQAQKAKDARDGITTDDPTLVRLHPLSSLWRMALAAAKQLDRLLAITNPQLFAQWKLAELEVRKQFKQSEKMKTAAA